MARLLSLPTVLRAAGLQVREVDGWRTRGSTNFGPVRGITCHATAGSNTSTDEAEIRVLLCGSATAPPPIAQLYLSRVGVWWVVASGRCNHNLTGWSGPNRGLGNTGLLGIEAQHSNHAKDPWPRAQYDSYARGVAALCEALDVPVARVAGHKEHQPYPPPPWTRSSKSDPTFDMDRFRADVRAVLAGKSQRGDDDMDLDDEVRPGLKIRNVFASVYDRTGTIKSGEIGKLLAGQAALAANLARLAGKDWVDEGAIVEGVLAGLGARTDDAVAAALVVALGADRARAVGTILADLGG